MERVKLPVRAMLAPEGMIRGANEEMLAVSSTMVGSVAVLMADWRSVQLLTWTTGRESAATSCEVKPSCQLVTWLTPNMPALKRILTARPTVMILILP